MRDLREEAFFMIEVGADFEETAEHRVCNRAWQTR